MHSINRYSLPIVFAYSRIILARILIDSLLIKDDMFDLLFDKCTYKYALSNN